MTHSAPSYFCSIPSTDIWYPVAPGTTTLPAAPTPTVNASPVPVNAAELPEDWDPAAPDLCYLFQDILSASAPAVFPLVVTPGSILPPYSETVTVLAVTRTVLSIIAIVYDLILPSTDVDAVSRTALIGDAAPGITLATRTVLIAEDPTYVYLGSITYSQSHIGAGNDAATNAGMTNGSYAETKQTATAYGYGWIRMDLGGEKIVKRVIIGADVDYTLRGSWGPSYTEDKWVQESTDGSTWTNVFATGTFSSGIQEYSVDLVTRYLQIVGTDVCVTEFYASSDP